MTKPRVGPKTDPSRSDLHYKRAARRRALKALDQALYLQAEIWRWRQIAEWIPAHQQAHRHALTMMQKANARQFGYLSVVRAALGYRADEDPPAPVTHWDKGAMEDPSDEGDLRPAAGED